MAQVFIPCAVVRNLTAEPMTEQITPIDGVTAYVTHADYKALEGRWREYAADVDVLSKLAHERYNEIERLTAELAECRRDAARYAHIRDRAKVEGHDGGWSSSWRFPFFDRHNDSPNKSYQLQRQSLDEAIDNEIARTKT